MDLVLDGFRNDFGIQVGPKINQKSVQEGMKNKMRFWMDFGWLLERYWVDFGSKLEARLKQSWHQKQRKKEYENYVKKDAQKRSSNEPSGKKSAMETPRAGLARRARGMVRMGKNG